MLSVKRKKSKQNFETDLTEGNVLLKLIVFILPIMLSGVLQQLYNAADTVVVGKFAGETALAAVGTTPALTNLILNLFLGLSVGSNVICARHFGAGNRDGLSRAVHTSVLLGLSSGILIGIFGIIFAPDLLALMGTPEDVLKSATLYMRIFFIGTPFSLLYNFGAGVLRAVGDTKRPLYILFASGIVNVGVNILCVVVFKMDVAGVALGTVVSQALSAVAILFILMRTDSDYKFSPRLARFHAGELRGIIRIGIPAGLNGIMFSFSNVIIQKAVNSFNDTTIIAGNTASANIEVFFFLVVSALEQGLVSFTGQNVGAGKHRRIDRAVFSAHVIAAVELAVMGITVYFARDFFLGLFTDSSDVIEIGTIKLTVVCVWYFVYIPNQICGGVLRGLGKSVTPTAINTLFICVVRIVWILVFYPMNPTLQMLYTAYPISWGLSSFSQLAAYLVERRKFKVRT